MSGEQLRLAATKGYVDEVNKLLLGGANVLSVDEHGISAIHYAAWNGKADCLEVLLSVEHGMTKSGEKSTAVNSLSRAGYTALHLAAWQGYLDCVEVLLQAGFSKDIGDVTPEELAREHGHEQVIELLKRPISEEEAEAAAAHMALQHRQFREHKEHLRAQEQKNAYRVDPSNYKTKVAHLKALAEAAEKQAADLNPTRVRTLEDLFLREL